jgi:hypothetical protein
MYVHAIAGCAGSCTVFLAESVFLLLVTYIAVETGLLTGDMTRLHHFTPHSKQTGMQGKRTSLIDKKCQSAKVMASVFLDAVGHNSQCERLLQYSTITA